MIAQYLEKNICSDVQMHIFFSVVKFQNQYNYFQQWDEPYLTVTIFYNFCLVNEISWKMLIIYMYKKICDHELHYPSLLVTLISIICIC